MMSGKQTIYELLQTDYARNYNVNAVNRMLHNLDKGTFYLGGQIKMQKNDLVGLEAVEKSKEITKQRLKEYGGPCNSWEMHSINKSDEELKVVEHLIKRNIT
jgi:hypothetical protein